MRTGKKVSNSFFVLKQEKKGEYQTKYNDSG